MSHHWFAPGQPLTEPLERLVAQLHLSTTGCLIIAVADDEGTRHEVVAELGRRLFGNVALSEFQFSSEKLSLAQHLRRLLPPTGPSALLTYGLSKLSPAERAQAIRYLNVERETLREAGYSVVLWVDSTTLPELTFKAPDFCAWRSGVCEFKLDLSKERGFVPSPLACLGLSEADRLRRLRQLYEEQVATPPPNPTLAANLYLNLSKVYQQLGEPEERVQELRRNAYQLLLEVGDVAALRRDYLADLADGLEWLDFKGIAGVKEAIQLRLADIYVALRAMPYGSREEQESARRRVAELLDLERLEAVEEMVREREEVQDALSRHPRLVVLGEPGSGKSTFLKYVTHALARGESLSLADAPLPLLASVKGYAEARREDHRLLLEAYLPRHIASQHKSPPGLRGYLAAELEAGHCLVLLDGLDEVRAEERVEIARQVQTFARRYGDKGNRLVVTSRIEGYWAAQLSGDFRHYILSEFGSDEIRSFAQQWCVAVERQWYNEEEARARGLAEADDLIAAILDWASVRRLAANPLLLTIIALIHRSRTQLPHHRIKLYAICFETLVETWGLARSLEGEATVGMEVHESEAVDVLGPLALWLHETKPGGTAPRQAIINRMVKRMVERGTEESQAKLIADRFLDVTREQCGLMAERGTDEYGFFHLTFEEYLAARDIARRRDRDRTALIHEHWPDPTWREIILLTAGQLGIMEASKDRVSDLLEDLLDVRARAEADRGKNVVLAGRALVDVGKETPLPRITKRVMTALRRTMQDVDKHDVSHDPPYVPIRTRADAGEVLDELGWLPPDLNAWGHVPGGPVYLHHIGCTETVSDFWMARYPVTNAQFERFIEAGGYNKPDYWPEKTGAREWWEGTERKQPYWWDDPRSGRSRRGYPMVGVTWYEALAYCAWLTKLLKRVRAGEEVPDAELVADLVDTPMQEITLPSEAEWAQAAGGEEGDRYPWDGEGESTGRLPEDERLEAVLARANVEESGLGHTTPVAMYPAGASFPSGREDGIMDLAGNVWEWTGDMDKDGWGWLRGGSWAWEADSARVGSYGPPDLYVSHLGCRVCARCSPPKSN